MKRLRLLLPVTMYWLRADGLKYGWLVNEPSLILELFSVGSLSKR